MSYFQAPPPRPTAPPPPRRGSVADWAQVARAARSAGHGGVIQLGDTLYQVVSDGSGLGGFSLKKIGKAVKKAAKQTVKVVKKAAPIAIALAPIPVVGGLVAKGLAARKAVKNLAPVKAVSTAQKNLATLRQTAEPKIPVAAPSDAPALPQYGGGYVPRPKPPWFTERPIASAIPIAPEQPAPPAQDFAAILAQHDADLVAQRAKERAERLKAKAAAPNATAADAAAAATATVAANAAAMQAQSSGGSGGGGGGGPAGGGAGYAAEPSSDASAPTDPNAVETPPSSPMGGSGMLVAAGLAALLLLGGKH